MTTDKHHPTPAEKAQDKVDEAGYKKYEKEQADYEKTKPGEIDEPAYKVYSDDYDKAHPGEAVKPAEDPDAVKADKEMKKAKSVRLTSKHSFYDTDGSNKSWDAGTIVTDHDEIKVLTERGAPIEVVEDVKEE